MSERDNPCFFDSKHRELRGIKAGVIMCVFHGYLYDFWVQSYKELSENATISAKIVLILTKFNGLEANLT